MLPWVQYLFKSRQFTSSESETRTSCTPTSPPPVSSTTPTKRMPHPPYQKFQVLILHFKHTPGHHSCPSHSLTTKLPSPPSSKQSPEFATMSTRVTCMLLRLKRSSESLAPSDTEGHPVKMAKCQLLLPNSIRSNDWNLSQISLHHHLPLTLPFWHLPYLS